jgi:hypothetical protein
MNRCSYKNGVAAARAVATPFVFVLAFCLISTSSALNAAVRVEGLNAWLSESANRSLNAVYEHMPQGESDEFKESLLQVVANRLLSGYVVRSVTIEGSDVVVVLEPIEEEPSWGISFNRPNLSPPVDEWFDADSEGIDADISSLMKGVPMEALSWGDLDLKREIDEIFAPRLPGWRTSLMVRTTVSGDVLLEVSFAPEQPLTLAVTSRINSASIPVMLHSNLRDDLLKGFAPVIGIPVPWLDIHKDDLVALSKKILGDEYLVDEAKAVPEVTAKTGTVSELDIDLESRRYAAGVWLAVYGGAEGKYPEAGLHFGRRTVPLHGWDVEMYGEFIVALNDWDLETRLGMRWMPWRFLWFGGEWSDNDDIWWLRASVESRPRSPYMWLRYSQDGDTNGAIGYRLNDYLSLELNYDSRDSDSWNVRALVNF